MDTGNQDIGQRTLLEKTQSGFGANLLRALQVSEFSDQGDPKKMTQEAISQTSGVARSTISKYLAQHKATNPDLETICRLASALNISPAMLLMTDDDWLRLAHATALVEAAKGDDQVRALIEDVTPLLDGKPAKRAAAVMKLTRIIGYAGEATKYLEDETYKRTLRGILGTAALPMHPHFGAKEYVRLIPLCVVMGARIIEQGK